MSFSECDRNQTMLTMPVHYLPEEQCIFYDAYQKANKCFHDHIDDLDAADAVCLHVFRQYRNLFFVGQQHGKCRNSDELVRWTVFDLFGQSIKFGRALVRMTNVPNTNVTNKLGPYNRFGPSTQNRLFSPMTISWCHKYNTFHTMIGMMVCHQLHRFFSYSRQ